MKVSKLKHFFPPDPRPFELVVNNNSIQKKKSPKNLLIQKLCILDITESLCVGIGRREGYRVSG